MTPQRSSRRSGRRGPDPAPVEVERTAPAASTDEAAAGPVWSPWRVVVGFGVISLAADMVYEGARSVYGPLLGSLGASALVVGAVTGAGEAKIDDAAL